MILIEFKFGVGPRPHFGNGEFGRSPTPRDAHVPRLPACASCGIDTRLEQAEVLLAFQFRVETPQQRSLSNAFSNSTNTIYVSMTTRVLRRAIRTLKLRVKQYFQIIKIK